MKREKWASLLMILAMVISLTACGSPLAQSICSVMEDNGKTGDYDLHLDH